MKKLFLILLAGVFVLTGCQNKENENEEIFKIGIIQFAEHGSLDNCREGVLKGLSEEGFEDKKNLKIDYQNANADTGIANQIAGNFAANKYDMIIAIATPAAMSAFNSCKDTDIPVIYTAVTDPIAAKLSKDDKTPNGNITGTSDILPVESQLELMRKVVPDAKKIGIIYTTSEVNSETMIKMYEEIAPKYDFEIITEAVNQTSDIPFATDNILKKVDVISNILDNTVVNSLPVILNKASEKSIPVFGSEIEQVKIGCVGACGLEYVDLGIQTGKIAARVLKGESAKEIPYETITDAHIYLNEEVYKNLGLEISDDLKSKADEIFKNIEN